VSEIVEIVKFGHGGDGVAQDGLFVPYTVPGDVARVGRDGPRGALDEIITPGHWRTEPPCRHFTRCGGCALQHVARERYLAWKRDLVVAALKQRGFTDAAVQDIRAVGPGTRRRAIFKACKGGQGLELGFYAPRTQTLIEVQDCPILAPSLFAVIGPLRKALNGILTMSEKTELHTTLTDTGIDLTIRQKRPRRLDWLVDLAVMAQSLKLARLCWNDELIAMNIQPAHRIGTFDVALPPESFLQPTAEGERILQDLVHEEIGSAKRIADLFSGCGTFALTLADTCAVHAVDNSGPQIGALLAAARTGSAKVTSETRDLFRRPLLPAELSRFDAVILDPPRPGALEQVRALAQSEISRVLYVSCNPASFARDARILSDSGFHLSRVVPLDQFLWSPHVELFAVFIRPKHGHV
jgi:23S rRNA (uracil1939-C5)-methyltransferase